ncbi:MAG: hypothetical protein A2022_07350 [Deltaproteobacteria bacterium GWF2_42_12]|nr:MAG: hypothetical protein A3G68_01580 [Candidatus Gottesmanbacteria bacterium RIFCSPLOWO2_12_FULL_42_10]OGP23053.1 MAG: hypothetical protein A2067_09035 [Deltaproteobacteria bacterium GWB2_42_7]OGP41251.1 MAG: hypothetical protein A2090_08680 [Deltaproteobacteria bacterium GWD2_42_10]OGP47650.1 MAG: hypothetical protein A2022_07350 [Deltaproteobacteria bacterium GWF2_42_12]OGQ73950.1 MAG: hypothetical protein A2235_00025 [Deltaproteobacteria bacterium RIFOXYA2_FULL_42_10]
MINKLLNKNRLIFLFPSSSLGTHLVCKLLLAREAELPDNCVPKPELGNEERIDILRFGFQSIGLYLKKETI